MRNRNGFTLIEVMVALALTGLVAIMARRLVQVTIESVQALEVSRREAEARANARGWLRSTLLSLEAGDSAGSFTGHAGSAEFSAWVVRPGGWMVRHRISLELSSGSFVAVGAAVQPVRLTDSVDTVEFDYLLEPGANTRWVQQWISPVSAPLAMRIRIQHDSSSDTLLFLIRERG